MSDRYKLVFRGEVLEGQHPAVVRKRLGQTADFDDTALEKLFSGRPVVLKREADTETAARLQVLFKKAGARLRVLPVEHEDAMSGTAAATPSGDTQPPPGPGTPAGPAPRPASGERSTDTEPELLPAGSDVLRADERTPWQPREIDTGELALEGARFPVPEETPAAAAPDVSHLSLAEAGSELGPPRESPDQVVQAPDLQIAETGADLAPGPAPPAPAVDFADLSFEVAPAGSDLGQRKSPQAPAAPDTSHLKLAD